MTGAGGWLGQATLELLEDALGDRIAERVLAFGASGRAHRLRSGRMVPIRPLPALADLPRAAGVTIVAHYAFLTREKSAALPPAGYADTNRALTRFVAAECRRLDAAGAFSTSSGAVYGPGRALAQDLAANPYGVLKLEEEEAFGALATEAGTRAVRCRVFNVAGPFLNKDYALGSFVADALAGRPILIRAERPVIRSYAHVRDIVASGLAAALGLVPPPEAPYDTAGERAVEMGELATRVLAVAGRSDLAVERPVFRPADDPDRYVGEGAVFRDLCRAAGLPPGDLDAQIRDTMDDLRDRLTSRDAATASARSS